MKNESRISVRTLTAMALLIAMSIVFSRVLSISTGFVRFNLGSLPVLLAGILFGPWAGFVVGMVADIIGGVLAGYAINPLITLGAASIGLVGGLGWQKLSHLRTGNRLWCSVLAAHFVGSMVITGRRSGTDKILCRKRCERCICERFVRRMYLSERRRP